MSKNGQGGLKGRNIGQKVVIKTHQIHLDVSSGCFRRHCPTNPKLTLVGPFYTLEEPDSAGGVPLYVTCLSRASLLAGRLECT